MPLYEITDDVLKEVSETNFVLEKDIQKIVEKNMKSVLNLEFMSTEFESSGLGIDSLGYDNDSIRS